jgi:hypothetical protein
METAAEAGNIPRPGTTCGPFARCDQNLFGGRLPSAAAAEAAAAAAAEAAIYYLPLEYICDGDGLRSGKYTAARYDLRSLRPMRPSRWRTAPADTGYGRVDRRTRPRAQDTAPVDRERLLPRAREAARIGDLPEPSSPLRSRGPSPPACPTCPSGIETPVP